MFILPFNRDNAVEETPWVLIWIGIINAFVLALTYTRLENLEFLKMHGFVPISPRLETAVTSMFMHGGIWHFVGNMWFFWMFGNKVEQVLGGVKFAVLYLACGFGALGLFWLANSDSTIPLVGASGAISGIAGAFCVYFPNNPFDVDIYLLRFKVKTIPTYTRVAVGVWFVEQLLLGILLPNVSIAFLAHVGGFLTGVLGGALLWLTLPNAVRDKLRIGEVHVWTDQVNSLEAYKRRLALQKAAKEKELAHQSHDSNK
jgi:membrane associated rhomboid family serine protease